MDGGKVRRSAETSLGIDTTAEHSSCLKTSMQCPRSKFDLHGW